MNIKEAKREIVHTVRAYHQTDEWGQYLIPASRQRPLLVMGPPGIGKTAIVEQVARECDLGLVSYTITHHTRQSAVGLPRIVEKTYKDQTFTSTEYTMSEIVASIYECIERTGKEEGILFIDEINCVSETLTPTMLQFLQKKTFGSHRIPEGYVIVAAGNPTDYNRAAKRFDIVTLDRVRSLDVEAELDCWISYAIENETHGAVISYLKIHNSDFYYVEPESRDSEKERSFVTARGWEDLSDLMKVYEKMGLSITESQIGQFIKEPEIVKRFADYYRLYCRYGEDYQIAEMLDGILSEEEYERKVQLAAGVSKEEKISITGLIVDALVQAVGEYKRQDQRTTALYERLRGLKGLMSVAREQESVIDVIVKHLEGQRAALRIREDLLDEASKQMEQYLLRREEEYLLRVKEEHIQEKEEAFRLMEELLGIETQKRKSLVEKIQEEIDRALAFAEKAYGVEGEIIALLTWLLDSRVVLEYLSQHGNASLFRYSNQLLGESREEELRKLCLDYITSS